MLSVESCSLDKHAWSSWLDIPGFPLAKASLWFIKGALELFAQPLHVYLSFYSLHMKRSWWQMSGTPKVKRFASLVLGTLEIHIDTVHLENRMSRLIINNTHHLSFLRECWGGKTLGNPPVSWGGYRGNLRGRPFRPPAAPADSDCVYLISSQADHITVYSHSIAEYNYGFKKLGNNVCRSRLNLQADKTKLLVN